YPVTIPARDVGLALAWVLPGVFWFARRAPLSHVLTAGVLLGFLGYACVRRVNVWLAGQIVELAISFAVSSVAGVCVPLSSMAGTGSIAVQLLCGGRAAGGLDRGLVAGQHGATA